MITSVMGFAGAFKDSKLVLATYSTIIIILSTILTAIVVQEYREFEALLKELMTMMPLKTSVKLGYILFLLWFPPVLSGFLICLRVDWCRDGMSEESEFGRKKRGSFRRNTSKVIMI